MIRDEEAAPQHDPAHPAFPTEDSRHTFLKQRVPTVLSRQHPQPTHIEPLLHTPIGQLRLAVGHGTVEKVRGEVSVDHGSSRVRLTSLGRTTLPHASWPCGCSHDWLGCLGGPHDWCHAAPRSDSLLPAPAARIFNRPSHHQAASAMPAPFGCCLKWAR